MIGFERLARAGIPDLIAPLALLLERLDGLEVDDPDDDPAGALARLVSRVAVGSLENPDFGSTAAIRARLVAELAELSVWRYQAAAGGERWDPLAEPYRAFKARAGDDLVLWIDPQPRVRERIRRWLEARAC